MKKILTFFTSCLVLLFTTQVNAQVQQKAKDALMEKYPNAEDVEWEEETNGYEAEFEIDGKEKEALFDQAGVWVETEWDIDDDDLPDAVNKTLERDFHGYEIEDTEGFESPQYGKNLYNIELESDNSEVEVLMNAEGEVLRRRVLEEVEVEDLVDEIEEVVD